MPLFTVKFGKEKIPVTYIIGCVCVCYKGKNHLIEPAEEGWVLRVGKLDNKTVQAIGEAIEKHLS